MQPATKKRIGILRGGEGKNYASSLQYGGDIISIIFENLGDKYKTLDILIDQKGKWHLNGVPILPADLISKVDVIWNTSNPNLSNILNSLSIPNVSNSVFSTALEDNRDFLREHMKNMGIDMPRHIVSPKSAKEVFEKFPAPWIVRISNEMKIVKTFDELIKILNETNHVIVEEFIAGKIASIHSVPNFRKESSYIFPLGNSFGIFSNEEKERLSVLAKDLHKHLVIKHYLKSDFILTPRGKIYLLQISGTPDVKNGSHFSEAVESVGAKMHHVVEHILENI